MDADNIHKLYELQPRKLNYLQGIIADLYVDTAKIKGFHNVAQRMSSLKNILDQYDHKNLCQFFNSLLQQWL